MGDGQTENTATWKLKTSTDIVQESSPLKLSAWLLKKADCTFAKTLLKGRREKKRIFYGQADRTRGGVSHLGPDRKEMRIF